MRDTEDAGDVPGEHRIDCRECGFDGGTYGYNADARPSYCPGCGTDVDDEAVVVVDPTERRAPSAVGDYQAGP